MMTDNSCIQVKDLTFGYQKTQPILQHIDIHLTAGDRCLLVGPNGSGWFQTSLFDVSFYL
jgi:ABC-type Mn2+/Zn2+ transport system ATPase subunit